MKKLLLTIVISLSLISAKAFNMSSELNIKIFDNSVFYVELDNNVFNNYTNQYCIPNVSSGNHFLKVFRFRPNYHGYYYNSPTVLFAGYIFVPAGMKVNSMIDLYNKYTVLSQSPIWGNDGYSGEWYDWDGYNNPPPSSPMPEYYGYMNPTSFMMLKSTMGNTAFDSSKLKIAEQAVSANKVLSEQVLDLMDMLTFESSKLELAKFAYKFTVDKNKYYLVNSGFTFSSSIDELNKYITGF